MARITEIDAERVATRLAEIREAMLDIEATLAAAYIPGVGDELGVEDAEGHGLRNGDRVQVTGSDRFGTTEGVVQRAVAGGSRVRVTLDEHPDVEYTPTLGRVHLIGADEHAQPQEDPAAA